MTQRTETDALGAIQLPAACLHGIHTARALLNFTCAGRPVRPALARAYGLVKQACAQVNHQLGALDEAQAQALEQACEELADGRLDQHIVVDAWQGGAGTSLNMNVNEVLANRALQLLDRQPGDYAVLDPLDHVNRHQSTNDTFPTALRVAALQGLRRLEQAVVAVLEACQMQEQRQAAVVKVGRTQLQPAVLMTLGREFGAFADAWARDRWRVHKCEERLRVIGLGGTAIGTGLGAPRAFIFRVVDALRALSGLPLARAENLVDAIANQDALVEVAGILAALAANLGKIAGDVRLLAGFGDLRLPARQAGSSIMPGKVNPVIPEQAQQAALRAQASQQIIAQAVHMGDLQINQFLPLIADELLGMIDLLDRACRSLAESCIIGIEADVVACAAGIDGSTALLTALVDTVGYQQASAWATQAAATGQPLRDLIRDSGRLDDQELAARTSPEAVNRLGSQ